MEHEHRNSDLSIKLLLHQSVFSPSQSRSVGFSSVALSFNMLYLRGPPLTCLWPWTAVVMSGSASSATKQVPPKVQQHLFSLAASMIRLQHADRMPFQTCLCVCVC